MDYNLCFHSLTDWIIKHLELSQSDWQPFVSKILRGDDMKRAKVFHYLAALSVMLFFVHGLRVVFSVMFGIIYDQVFAGSPGAWLVVSNGLVVLAFLAPALSPRRSGARWLATWVAFVALARILLSVNEAAVRFWGSVAVVAAGGLYLDAQRKNGREILAPAFLAALVLDQVLRLLGWTYDLSLQPVWLPVQVVWSLIIVLWAFRSRRQQPDIEAEIGGWSLWDSLAFGCFLFIEVSLLSLPNAIARWSATPYPVVASLLVFFSLLCLGIVMYIPNVLKRIFTLPWRIGLALVLSLALVSGYFTPGTIALLSLLVAQVLVLFGFSLTLGGESSPRGLSGGSLALGMFFFLLLNYFNAFAFTYPYALPFMRGLGWAVYQAAALLGGLGIVVSRGTTQESVALFVKPAWTVIAGLVVLVLTLISVLPRPVAQAPLEGKLRVATYNIHYGYDTYWHFTLEDISRTLLENEVDIVTMQEVDTGRLTSYAVDDAYYLARRLGMEVLYLPTVEHLTGIAVLYHGQALATNYRLLSSLQEQTGIAQVRMDLGGSPLNAYGIWMGLSEEDTQKQITEALGFIGDNSPAVFGGDFNASPGSPVALAVEDAGFIDPFIALEIDPPPLTDPAIHPSQRIDFVWLHGLTPLRAWVPEALASDHRMVVVEIKIP